VRDNSPGFSLASAANSRGIQNMLERIGSIRGTPAFVSRRSDGLHAEQLLDAGPEEPGGPPEPAGGDLAAVGQVVTSVWRRLGEKPVNADVY
jgi:hypothetical protein